MASLDGIDGDTLVEIKNSSWTFKHLKEGHVEEHYYAQIQQQLYCSPATTGYLFAHCPKTGEYACSKPITLETGYMDKLDAAWSAFDAMPVPEGDLDLSDDTGLLVLLERFATLKMEADHVKDSMDELREKIVEYAPERTVLCNGHKIVYKQGANRVDYKKACADNSIPLEAYEKRGAPTYAISLQKSPFEADNE